MTTIYKETNYDADVQAVVTQADPAAMFVASLYDVRGQTILVGERTFCPSTERSAVAFAKSLIEGFPVKGSRDLYLARRRMWMRREIDRHEALQA